MIEKSRLLVYFTSTAIITRVEYHPISILLEGYRFLYTGIAILGVDEPVGFNIRVFYKLMIFLMPSDFSCRSDSLSAQEGEVSPV